MDEDRTKGGPDPAATAAAGANKLPAGNTMPKFAVRKKARRRYVSDANGVLSEVQVAGAEGDPASGGTIGVWGAHPPAGLAYGTPSSTDDQDTGEVQEFPDANGEAQGLLFLNNHQESSFEFLVHADTTPPAFGDLINTSYYVTRVQKRGQATGWTTLSIQCRTI